MKRCSFLISSFIITLLFVNLAFTEAQRLLPDSSNVLIEGQVINRDDSLGIPFVHVIKKYTWSGVISDGDGRFKISVSPYDSLIFSSLGYENKVFSVLAFDSSRYDSLIIALKEQIYMIDEVEIWQYKTYGQFREAVRNLDLPEEQEIEIEKPELLTSPGAKEGVSVGVDGPITAIYDILTGRAQEMEEYRRLLREDKIRRRISRKYNDQIITNMTGIENPKKLREFKDFCNFSRTFLLKARELDIYFAIDDCFERYKKIKALHGDPDFQVPERPADQR